MMYYRYMGGVDHLDWLIQEYQIGVRRKKLYLYLLSNLVDKAMLNAWIISAVVSGNQTSLLDFKSSIARYYLKMSSPSKPEHPGQVQKIIWRVLHNV